jgi:hypothetical protein
MNRAAGGLAFVSATISFLMVFGFFHDELVRRLGAFCLGFSIVWVGGVFGLLVICTKLISQLSGIALSILGSAIGYASGLMAFVLVVSFDVLRIGHIHSSYGALEVLVPLYYPFLALKGWLYCLLFSGFTSLFGRASDK